MRVTPLGIPLLVAACAHHQPVTPVVATASGAQMCTNPANSSARPTGFHLPASRSMAEGMRRIDSLGSLVDTIVVHPDSLVLHVGESIDFHRIVAIELRRSSGEPVPTAPEWLAVQDLSVVQFRDAGLTGLKAGHTNVVVTVFSNTPNLPAHAPPSCIAVRVDS